MREIVLDTETTGLSPENGDRVVEIGCVELVKQFVTGRSFHVYINPERPMPRDAFEVHGLSDEFLADKPRFADIADAFLAFIDDARLVIHNANFDLSFLNKELALIGRPALAVERVLDTVPLARRKHPGSPANLDALCARYGINAEKRTKHGALLDAELLAEVYIELNGGRQAGFDLSLAAVPPDGGREKKGGPMAARPMPLPPRLTAEERQAHEAFIASLGTKAVWRHYFSPVEEA